MKHYSNVKSIGLKVRFDGNGCVNFDSNDQKFVINTKGLGVLKYDNNCLAKKNFYSELNEKGEVVNYFKHKVSSECLKHEIFKETMPFHNENISGIPYVLYNTISMPDYIMRGYVFTGGKGENGLKKKSPFMLTDAEEIGKSYQIVTDFHSKTGFKETNTSKDEGKDNSIYNIESVGAKTYEAIGAINLMELQFIPDDPIFDRMSLAVEDGSQEESIFIESLKNNMVNFTPVMKYYSKNGCYGKDSIGERGILLNEDSVDMIVKRTLRNLLNVNINRRNAFFKTSALEITVNMADGSNETFNVALDNLDDFYFGYAQEYTESNQDAVKENVNLINKFRDKKKEDKKNSKSSKKSSVENNTEE